MGAHDYFFSADGHLTQKQVDAALEQQQIDDELESFANGQADGDGQEEDNAYTGDSRTVSRARLHAHTIFKSGDDQAQEYILRKAKKWESFVAVHVEDGAKKYTLIGGWAAS